MPQCQKSDVTETELEQWNVDDEYVTAGKRDGTEWDGMKWNRMEWHRRTRNREFQTPIRKTRDSIDDSISNSRHNCSLNHEKFLKVNYKLRCQGL